MLKNRQMGFTLVEIAIVLVIVGLLIGGVLKGQEMITNAKLKRVESDNAGVLAGLYSYQDRYLQLPGDDGSADSRFSAYTSTEASGDGDGNISGLWDVASPSTTVTTWATDGTQETVKFFAHLRAAGLVAGGATDASRPTNAFGGQIGVQEGSLSIGGQVTIFGSIDGAMAQILDGRLDDGVTDTGRVMSNVTGAGMASGQTGASTGAYIDTNDYDMAFRL